MCGFIKRGWTKTLALRIQVVASIMPGPYTHPGYQAGMRLALYPQGEGSLVGFYSKNYSTPEPSTMRHGLGWSEYAKHALHQELARYL